MRFHVRVVGVFVLAVLLYLVYRNRLRQSTSPAIRIGVDTPRLCDNVDPKIPPARDYYAHRLAIVVPYRDRWPELVQMVPHLNRFLKGQDVDHQFWIVNQTDDWRFNRGSLLNAGAVVSETFGCDYIALHDVDLLPNQPQLSYQYPSLGPYHVSAPGLHPKYKFSKFLGGILLMSRAHYAKVNGFSNMFWGWGKEDDDFRRRILLQDLVIYRPPHLPSGMKDTFKHVHGEERVRDTVRHSGQEVLFNITDPSQGYNSLIWDDACIRQVEIDGIIVNFLNVKLNCDIAVTPWCQTIQN